jgi:hypothetical protein
MSTIFQQKVDFVWILFIISTLKSFYAIFYAPSRSILSAMRAINSPLVGFSLGAYTFMPKM